MAEGWQIRGACSADAAEVARLSGLLGYPAERAGMLARLQALAVSADHWVAVAAPLGAPSGAGVPLGGWMHVARRIALESGEFAEILGLVVEPAARRGGVGRSLAAAAEHWARTQRLARLTVRSNVARSESHAFYPALGFARSKSQHVYSKALGSDAGSVA